MTNDVLGTAELAVMLNVSPRRAREIALSYGDFPVPVVLKRGRIWDRPSVEAWINRHQRAPGRPSKISLDRHRRLSWELGAAMSRVGMTAAELGRRTQVPESYVQSLLDAACPSRDWPSVGWLVEAGAALGSPHPALLLDAGGYPENARAERHTFGR